MNQIIASLKGYVYGLSLPKIGVVDILEIIIIVDILGKAYKSMDTGKGCFCAV